MDSEEEEIVNAFLNAHAEVYPDEPDIRDGLDLEKLASDARALLLYGMAASSIEHLIRRDMKRRPGLGMVSPNTIRFCVRSVERAAKAGSTMEGRAKAALQVKTPEELEASRKRVEWARRYVRGDLDDGYVRPPSVASHVVRPDWRKIRRGDLSAAELALAIPEIERMAAEAKANIAKFMEKRRMDVRPEDFDVRPKAKEIIPPAPLPDIDDPAVQKLLREMEPEGTA